METYSLEKKKQRICLLDELRGFALICMVFHHAMLDIGDVWGMEIGYRLFNAFHPVQPIFWMLFIGISGISSRLSRNNTLRGVKLLGIAIGLSIVTIVVLPWMGFQGTEIWFGILHFLACAMLIFSLLRPLLDKLPPLAGMLLCAALFLLTGRVTDGYFGFSPFGLFYPERWNQIPWLFPLGITTPDFYSADYFPLLPWVFLFLLGTFLGVYAKKGDFPKFTYRSRVPFFSLVGRHGLLLYVLHQPVLYALFWIAGKIFRIL